MDAGVAARFKAGAGIDPGELHQVSVALVGVAVILWAAWVMDGLYRQWQAGRLEMYGLLLGVVRAAALAGLIVFFIR